MPVGVVGTGGRIDEMVAALIAAANDTEGSVRSGISRSLQDIGKKQPNLVLSSCAEFIQKNPKMPQEHRIQLLNIMHQVLEFRRDEVSPELAVGLVLLGMNEMTEQKEVVPEWQSAASALLVSLGMRFPNEILDELLKKFSPGTIPHYFVMKTLGDFAAANAMDAVPRLRDILSRVLPVLGGIKQENMRWVFAAGIGHFCEAVLTYVANIDRGADKSINTYSFSSDVYPAYEILFNNWLQSKEAKVRLATVQALGSVCACISRDQFEAQLPKIIPTVLGMYKKEKELLPITQGFNVILDVCVKDRSRVLDPQLVAVLNVIHPLACQFPESNNSTSIKNYNELLRCFQTLGLVFSDEIVTYLLERLNGKDNKLKVGTLAIIKHLVTRLIAPFEDKKGLLVTGIKPIALNEKDLKVKRELAQVVIAMASQNYLSHEGGETLVEFIIQNASIPDEEIAKYEKSKDRDPTISPEELRALCDNIVNLAATTIDNMQPVLWPYLFETLVPNKYTAGLAVICKCIAHLAGLKREQDARDYFIDFDRNTNLPKPQAIIARLFVLVNAPLRRGQLGVQILSALKNIGPILHPSICDMWDNAIPKLSGYLEANSSSLNTAVWEDLIIRLLSETIKMVNDDDWTTGLANQLSAQFELYNNDPEMKRVALKHMGLILQKSNHKESIRTKLETMLAVTDGNSEPERTGCAQGIGYCAVNHLDMALERVQAPPKGSRPASNSGSGGGLFSFMSGSKDKSEGGNVEVNNTTILCYGYIAAYAQPTLITSRIDVSVINHLKPMMAKAKTTVSKECIIKTIELIGKAMHPSHLKKDYILKQRDDLLKQLLTFLTPTTAPAPTSGGAAPAKVEKFDIPDSIIINGLSAASSLVNLDPILPPDLERVLLDRIATFYTFHSGSENILNQVQENMNLAFASVLCSDPSVECLKRIFSVIETYSRSKDSWQREKATVTILFLMKKFAEIKVNDLDNPRRERRFTECGNTIAMLIPRVTDPIIAIRQSAIQTVQISLYVDYILKSNNANVVKPDEVAEIKPFQDFRERIKTDDVNEQFSIVHEMSRDLSKLIAADELPDLLLNLLRGLNDPQLSSTSGTCVMFNGIIKARGKELLPKIPPIISGLLKAMETITNDQTMNGTLHAVRSLAVHHETQVIDELLLAPVPHSNFVVKSLQAIGKDENLVDPMIHHLFDILNTSQLYEEKTDPKSKKNGLVANHTPMSATCALGELMQLEELEDVVSSNYALFASSLLLRIGTANGMVDNQAADQAVETWRRFIECSKDIHLSHVMSKDDNWVLLSSADNYYKPIQKITSGICKSHANQMQNIYELMVPYIKGNFIGQKVISATVIAQLIAHCQNEKRLLNLAVNCLLSCLVDNSIKFHCLTGLGNIVAVGHEEANKYAPTVLDALLSSIDDANELIAKEAMNGLAKVFEMAEDARISPILVNICHRIRPAFDKENDEIRAAAFNLFGSLSRFGEGAAAEPFYEQIHNNLPAIVLHVDDTSPAVRSSCKGALRKLAPLFRCEDMRELLLSPQLDPERSLQYNEFLNDLSKVLIEHFVDRLNYYVMTSVNEYFKSNWNVIKINAATFVGFTLGNLTPEKRKASKLNPALISKALIGLLKEKDPQVRKAVAEAVSLLYSY